MINKTEVENIVNDYINLSGLFLVDVAVNPGNVIHVQVDKPEGVSIEECVELNRFILEKLDKETEDYELQVSSPGLGLPLKVLPQYLKNIGRTVEVVKTSGTKMKGLLLNATKENIEIEISKKIKKEGQKRPEIIFEPVIIQMNDIKNTKVLVSFK